MDSDALTVATSALAVATAPAYLTTLAINVTGTSTGAGDVLWTSPSDMSAYSMCTLHVVTDPGAVSLSMGAGLRAGDITRNSAKFVNWIPLGTDGTTQGNPYTGGGGATKPSDTNAVAWVWAFPRRVQSLIVWAELTGAYDFDLLFWNP